MKKYFLLFSVFFCQFIFSQENKCNLEKSSYGIYRIDANDVKCLAKYSEKPHTIFFTFAIWCSPCINHLSNAKSLELYNNSDFYVVLIDKEKETVKNQLAIDYINKYYPNTKIVILKDVEKNGKRKKYKEFLKEITPKQFEVIDDMSKYIILDKSGDVKLVTTWKDGKNDPDWKDDKPMIRRLILPLLKQQ
jgi:hypothetical protein